jgi:6-phosphogluconolactonase (cycloisomerase 2 family)
MLRSQSMSFLNMHHKTKCLYTDNSPGKPQSGGVQGFKNTLEQGLALDNGYAIIKSRTE